MILFGVLVFFSQFTNFNRLFFTFFFGLFFTLFLSLFQLLLFFCFCFFLLFGLIFLLFLFFYFFGGRFETFFSIYKHLLSCDTVFLIFDSNTGLPFYPFSFSFCKRQFTLNFFKRLNSQPECWTWQQYVIFEPIFGLFQGLKFVILVP